MSTIDTTVKGRGTRARRSRRLTAAVFALALAALTAGSAAAAPLDRDNKRETPLWSGVNPTLVAKLGTKAGYEVLAFG